MERQERVARIRDWVEPAHPGVVQLHDDLVSIYSALRERVQDRIDATFDEIARTIGFVVTTTVPVTLFATKEGQIERAEVSEPHLKGTLFERGIGEALEPVFNTSIEGLSEGSYKILIIWREALKLRLRRDWVEPAHVVTGTLRRAGLEDVIQVGPDVREPAHWFDPDLAIAVEELLVITALDEVYPELRLAERITAARADPRQFVPGVREPAHFRASELFANDAFVEQLEELVRRFTR